jgi:hypothetical protein
MRGNRSMKLIRVVCLLLVVAAHSPSLAQRSSSGTLREQEAEATKQNKPKLRVRGSGQISEQKIRLKDSQRFMVRLSDPISSKASQPFTTETTGTIISPIYDYLGKIVVPADKQVNLEYSVTPSKSFRRKRGEITLSIKPITHEFSGEGNSNCSDCADLEPGTYDIRFTLTLESISDISGKTLIAKKGEYVTGSGDSLYGSGSASQSIPLIREGGQTLAYVSPLGILAYGVITAGAGFVTLIAGKSDLTLNAQSQIRFNLDPIAVAKRLSPPNIIKMDSERLDKDDPSSMTSREHNNGKSESHKGQANIAKSDAAANPNYVRLGLKVPHFTEVTVIAGMDISLDGKTSQPIPQGRQAALHICRSGLCSSPKDFTRVSTSLADEAGVFTFKNVPCGCKFKVIVDDLYIPGAAPRRLPLLDPGRPVNYPKEMPLPCLEVVGIGRYFVRILPENR